MGLRAITVRNQRGEELQLRPVEQGPHPPRDVEFTGEQLTLAP